MSVSKHKNRLYRRSKISEYRLKKVLRCFAENLTASETSRRTGISVRSVNSIFIKLRQKIAQNREAFFDPDSGQVIMGMAFHYVNLMQERREKALGLPPDIRLRQLHYDELEVRAGVAADERLSNRFLAAKDVSVDTEDYEVIIVQPGAQGNVEHRYTPDIFLSLLITLLKKDPL